MTECLSLLFTVVVFTSCNYFLTIMIKTVPVRFPVLSSLQLQNHLRSVCGVYICAEEAKLAALCQRTLRFLYSWQ